MIRKRSLMLYAIPIVRFITLSYWIAQKGNISIWDLRNFDFKRVSFYNSFLIYRFSVHAKHMKQKREQFIHRLLF